METENASVVETTEIPAPEDRSTGPLSGAFPAASLLEQQFDEAFSGNI